MIRYWQAPKGRPQRIYMRHGHFEVYIQREPGDRFSYGPNPPGGELTADIFKSRIPDVISWSDAVRILGVDTSETNATTPVVAKPVAAADSVASKKPTSPVRRPPTEQQSAGGDVDPKDVLRLIPGLSEPAMVTILGRYGTLRAIANATAADLAKLPGVDPAAARALAVLFNLDCR